jgi:anti-sigma factor RsiW
MMEKLKALWETAKNTLHYGPSTEPLWAHVVEVLHAFEARLAALETGLEDRVKKLLSGAELALQADFDAMKSEYASVIAALEARIAAIEGHPAVAIPPLVIPPQELQPETAPAPAPAASTEPVAPSETVHLPDQPAADGAKVSSGDDKAATPSVQPSLEAAGQTQGENHG